MTEKNELLENLPPKARAKFAKMKRHAQTLRGALRAYYDDIQSERETLNELLAAWRRQQDTENNYTLPEPAEAEKLRQSIATLNLAREEAAKTADVAWAPVLACQQWLADMAAAGAKIVQTNPSEVRGARAGDAAKAVDAIRKRVAEIAVEYQSVENAPAPREDLKARSLEALAELAELGRPDFYTNQRVGDPIKLEERLRLQSSTIPGAVGNLTASAANFVAWALHDVLAERIVALIDKHPCDGALSDDERDARLCTLANEKLTLERQEEDLIEKSEAAGMFIARRGDADPRAILVVSDV